MGGSQRKDRKSVRRQATGSRLRQERTPARASTFDGWYGAFYDASVSAARQAPWTGWLMWGCDLPRVFRMMAEGIACEPGQVVLDAPTGGGVTFAGGAVATRGLLVGVDSSRGMLERAAARRELSGLRDKIVLVRGDATRLPFRDGCVDRVLCFNSLHCIPQRLHGRVLRELRRVLRPGGVLLGTTLVSDARGPWLVNVRLARLAGFFTPPDSNRLAAWARSAGFRVWRTERAGALLCFRGQ